MMRQDMMVYYYSHPTVHGPVRIVPRPNGRYEIVFQDEDLGSYANPMMAADDAAGGHTFSPSSGVDLGDLDISYDLGDWERKPFALVKRLRRV